MGSDTNDPSLSFTHGVRVLMFTDIVSSTDIEDKVGPVAYWRLKIRHDKCLSQAMAWAPSGKPLRDTGDGYFISFDSISEAVCAALVFQWQMAHEKWDHPFTSRVGLHLGQVEQSQGLLMAQPYYSAFAINLASRTMSLACGGQILLTRTVYDGAQQAVREHPVFQSDTTAKLRWMPHGPYEFKGVNEPVEIFEIGAEGVAPFVTPPDSEKVKRHVRWRPSPGRPLEDAPNWIITERLGEGRFGETWLAEQADTGAKRVFKFCFDENRLTLLKREKELLCLLRMELGERSDISRVIDWRFEKRPYFIELQRASCGSLGDWVQSQAGLANVPLRDRLRIISQIAVALSAAHGVGVLHKHIKPSNVLMARDGNGPIYPRLTDFGVGIATGANISATGADVAEEKLTTDEPTSAVPGIYTPPESLMNKPHTVQGDVYSLGVLLYQMVVGDLTRPLGIGWESQIPDDLLREDLAACVYGDPSRRLSSAAALAERLEKLEDRHRERDRHAAQEQALRLARRRWTQVRVLSASLVALAIVVLVVNYFRQDASRQRDEAKKQRNALRIALGQSHIALAQTHIDIGWMDYDRGDVSAALLHFTKAQSLDPTSANRMRALAILPEAPRLCVPTTVSRITGISSRCRVLKRRRGFYYVLSPDPGGLKAAQNRASDTSAAMSPDGSKLVTAYDKAARIWETASGESIAGPMEHEGVLMAAAFSPDGSKLVTASADNTARVWDAATGKPITPLLKHESAVTVASFSPDGSKVLTASDDHTARIWDASTGRPLTPPLQHQNAVYIASFSADGTKALTGSSDHTARVWDAAHGNELATILIDGEIRAGSFSPDGLRVVTASNVDTARIWNAFNGTPLTDVMVHQKEVNAASFSPDGSKLVTASEDHLARVWDASGKLLSSIKHRDSVWDASFNSDGSKILTASGDTTVQAWETATANPLTPPMNSESFVLFAAFSLDGSKVIVASEDHVSRVWDVLPARSPTPELRHQDFVATAWFSPDGLRVISASEDGTARVWDAATGKPLTSPLQHPTYVTAAAFSSDGSRIVTSCYDQTVRVWDATSGLLLTSSNEQHGRVGAVSFSPDGSKVLTANYDHTARIWDAKTGRQVTPPLNHKGPVVSASFSPDGLKVVTASEDHYAQVWDANTGQPLPRSMNHADEVCCALFSPDGSKLLTASRDHTARLWDASTGRELTPPLKHQRDVTSASFSMDGLKVVTASSDRTARVWDALTGKPLTVPMEHQDAISSARFSPDGSKVITASNDKTARIWDAMTGNALTPPIKHGDSVTAACFSPEGSQVLTASDDHTARLWKAQAPNLSDHDLQELAELTSARRIDETNAMSRLSVDDWRGNWKDLTQRHPELFLPPPTRAVFLEEMARTPVDASRLKMMGEWFHQRGENEFASQLLEKARSATAVIEPLMLARCEWMAHRYPQAAAEFQAAINANSSPGQSAYLKQCLAAVQREAVAAPTARTAPSLETLPATQPIPEPDQALKHKGARTNNLSNFRAPNPDDTSPPCAAGSLQ